MAVEVAAHTMGVPHLGLADGVRFLASAGYDAVELICQDGYQCGLGERASEREVSAAAKMVADAGLRVSCLVPYVKAYNSPDDRKWAEALDDARRAVDIAAGLTASGMRILTGVEVEAPEAERAWARMVESLRTLAEYADRRGVDLWLENHMDTQITTAVQLAELVREIDHARVGITYDPCNLVIMGEPDDRGRVRRPD